MKRMNQKGITSIELLVSFILISTIVVSMFNMIMNYKNEEQIESIENQVIQYENNLQILKADIIKVAHHGSKTSSKKELLKCIKPKIALIGVGKNNKFGHPSINTLNNLEEIGCKIFRTDDSGEICITINQRGKIVKIKEWIKSS